MTGWFLAIPTYWGPEGGPDTAVADIYDHPTPLEGPGTLRRALESLAPLVRPGVRVGVVAAPTFPELAGEVEARVRQVVADPPLPYPVVLCGPSHLKIFSDYVRAQGDPAWADLLSLRGYGAIRNLTLILAALWDAEALVSLDDDEVIEDAAFLEHIETDVRLVADASGMAGLAGVYEDAAGSLLAQEPQGPWAAFWPKLKLMNDTWRELLHRREQALPRTPLALGGNMVIPRSLYRRVPFDPRIPRGEDVDYVMNARMFGASFFLDPELRVRHLPPDKPHPLWRRLRQDVLRFAYARRKLRAQEPRPGLRRVTPEELMPYPGAFLGDNLEELVFRSHTVVALEYLAAGDAEGARRTLETLTLFHRENEARDNAFLAYMDLAARWQALQAWLARPGVARSLREAVWGKDGGDPGAS